MYRAQTQVHTCMIVQLRNVYMASLGLTGSPDTEQVHDAFKLVIHHFGRFLVDFFSELPRHDVLALPELAEQPLCARVDKRDRRGGLEHQDSEAVELEARVLDPWKTDHTNINGHVTNVARANEPLSEVVHIDPLLRKDLRDEIRVNPQAFPNPMVTDKVPHEQLGISKFLSVRRAVGCHVGPNRVKELVSALLVLLTTRVKHSTQIAIEDALQLVPANVTPVVFLMLMY